MLPEQNVEEEDEIDDEIDYNDDEDEDDESEVDELNLHYNSSIVRDLRSVVCIILTSLPGYSGEWHTSTRVSEIGRIRGVYWRKMNVCFVVFTQKVGVMKKFTFLVIIGFIVLLISVIFVHLLPKHKIAEAEESSYADL